MKIDLSLIDVVGIIIKDSNSPITYSNQTGGIACLHPEQRGYFLPIQETMSMLFIEQLDYVYEATRISNKLANEIDEALSQSELHSFIKVDRTKLSFSYEAWVHVKVSYAQGIFEQEARETREEFEGILTWPNSD